MPVRFFGRGAAAANAEEAARIQREDLEARGARVAAAAATTASISATALAGLARPAVTAVTRMADHAAAAMPVFSTPPTLPRPDPTAPAPGLSMSLIPSAGDAFDALPPLALEKFRHFEDNAAETRALGDALYARFSDAQGDLQHAQRQLAHLQKFYGSQFEQARLSEQSVIDAELRTKRCRAELDRVQQQQSNHTERSRGARDLEQRLRNYVTRDLLVRGGEVELAPPTTIPVLAKGQRLEDALEALRTSIARGEERLAAIDAATLPAAEAKARIRASIGQLSDYGKTLLSVWPVLEGRGVFAFPRVFDGKHYNGPEGVIAYLLHDEIVARLEAEIDAVADDSCAMTHEQQIAARAEAERDLLALGRLEEALVTVAEQAGTPIARRTNVDPRCVLHLSDEAPPPRR